MTVPAQTDEKPTDATLTRRERERLARRRAMLDAARAVFAEKGYTEATLEEIAQRAEFGKGTLYNYFEGGKEEILFAIFDELYEEMAALITASFAPEQVEGQPLRAVFQGFVARALTFFMQHQDLFLIAMKEAHRLTFSEDRDKMAYFMEQRERLVRALVTPLKAAMDRGDVRRLPPHAVAHLILGNINGLQMHMTLQSCAQPSPEGEVLRSVDRAAAFLTTMLFDGLSTAPATPAADTDSTIHTHATS